MLGRAEVAERELGELARGESGTLRLAVSSPWAPFMPKAVAAFSSPYPRVQLELDQMESEAALNALEGC